MVKRKPASFILPRKGTKEFIKVKMHNKHAQRAAKNAAGLPTFHFGSPWRGRYRQSMFRMFLMLLAIFPTFVFGATLKKEELVGKWIPSGEIPREEGIADYALTVMPDFNATYNSSSKGYRLACHYKPSSSQDSVFVWYCFLKEKHLITLSLAGWAAESGSLLFGYEYWLGHPEPGQIHGGLPVSLEPATYNN